MTRRWMTVASATVSTVALSAGAAFAHECYNASRSEAGNANAARSVALSSYDELLDLLCDDGDALVEAAVASTGFETDGVLVNTNALMAGGAVHTGHYDVDDGHAIDYLPEELHGAIGQAFGVCFGPPPS